MFFLTFEICLFSKYVSNSSHIFYTRIFDEELLVRFCRGARGQNFKSNFASLENLSNIFKKLEK